MYMRFFGLHHVPFSIAPDPHYLFMSERHREALAHLLYGLDGGGGFVLLTGEIGAGKTTICRLFVEQIPARCNVAYLFNPKQTVTELLQSVCNEFGMLLPFTPVGISTVKDFIDPLNKFLLAAHAEQQNNILIIDEAQNLSVDVLEQLRLLTNLETNQRKLLQIILIGQPELRTMLAKPELEQLAQRIIARFHLGALSAEETAAYIAHRLSVAGSQRASPFSARVMRRIHVLTRGIPRRINLLCDRALLGAYAGGKSQVDLRTVGIAAREVFDLDKGAGPVRRGRRWLVLAGIIIAVGAVVFVVAPYGLLRKEFAGRILTAPKLLPQLRMAADLHPAKVTPVVKAPGAASPASVSAVSAAPVVTTPLVAVASGSEVRDLTAAYLRLGELWQLAPEEGDFCQAAQRQNIFCYTSKNGLEEIRRLNRPAILTLLDDQDQPYYVLLTALAGETATLRIGATVQIVTRNSLARRWRGGFTTLWRGPADYHQAVKGARGVSVDWIASRLAAVGGRPIPHAGSVFNAGLSTRIREFQLNQGLAPDGLPGPQTLMRLATMADDTEPRLLTGK